MNYAIKLPAGLEINLNSDVAYSLLIGIIVFVILILIAVPVFRFYFKKETEPGRETEEDKPVDKKEPIIGFITAIAFTGILAAIAIMAFFNIAQGNKVNDLVNQLKEEERLNLSTDEVIDPQDPTKNVPSPDFEAERFFPTTLDERPNKPPAPGPPPAVSKEAMVLSGPILKTEPYQVFLSPTQPQSSFVVRNDGNVDLEFSLSPNSSMISVSPANGVVKPAQELPITVSGTVTGMIRVTSNHLNDVVEVYYTP